MQPTTSPGAEIELGVYSLTDVSSGDSLAQRIHDIVDYGVAADQAGLDVFGVGEHHAQEIAKKLAIQRELFGANRFIGLTDLGGLPHARVRESLDRLAADVAPVLRHESRSAVRRSEVPAGRDR
jgi:hypothetical protein